MQPLVDLVTKLFIAADQHHWDTVKSCFASTVILDYSSMTGEPAARMSNDEIVQLWKSFLPGFESTHHQLGNFVTSMDNEEATVLVYGTASHYLPNPEGSLWTVVGTYHFDVVKQTDIWAITRMVFDFKYQSGNEQLAEAALANTQGT